MSRPAFRLLGFAFFFTLPLAAENGSPERQSFQWKPALAQSSLFLSIEHGFRFATEPGSRAELDGPFWRDYVASIKGIRGWSDGDTFLVNYIGHPFQGAVAGYIQVQNDPGFRKAEFGLTRPYLVSRARALGFSALYSTQFEIGPLSEAAFGNLGKPGVGGAGAVDLVVTPLGGVVTMAVEDSLDRYLIKRIERWTTNRPIRVLSRTFLNPNRTFANILRFRTPWHRDTRAGVRY